MYSEKQLEILKKLSLEEEERNRALIMELLKPEITDITTEQITISPWEKSFQVRFESDYRLIVGIDTNDRYYVDLNGIDTRYDTERAQQNDFLKAVAWFSNTTEEEVREVFSKISVEARDMLWKAETENRGEENAKKMAEREVKVKEAEAYLEAGKIYKKGDYYYLFEKITEKTVFAKEIMPGYRNENTTRFKKEVIVKYYVNGDLTKLDGDKTPEEIAYQEADKYLKIGQSFKAPDTTWDRLIITGESKDKEECYELSCIKDGKQEQLQTCYNYSIKYLIAKGFLKPIEQEEHKGGEQ